MSRDDTPKVFKKGYGSNFVIPFAIVLIGSLIIFGVTKMLRTDRGYKDLVRELHSKTFGNRWIAAFELSKVISANGVPEDEVPWLVENLEDLYLSAGDNRTKNFIIVTLGALNTKDALDTIEKGLIDSDPQTKFHSIVALSKMDIDENYDWSKVFGLLKSSDEGLKQASILTLATHRVPRAKPRLLELLSSGSRNIRYASATGLIYYQEDSALPTIQKILELQVKPGNSPSSLNEDKVYGLKLNIINSLRKTRWKKLARIVTEHIKNEKNLKLVSAARQVLDELKD